MTQLQALCGGLWDAKASVRWHAEAFSGQAWQGPVGLDMGCKQPQASRAVFGDAISASTACSGLIWYDMAWLGGEWFDMG